MKKLNFEKKLIEWFEVNRGRKFEWGKFDCAIAILEAIEIVYGEKLHPITWANEEEAVAAYVKIGGSKQFLIESGFARVESRHTGDIAVLKIKDMMRATCVVINDKYTVFGENDIFQLRGFTNEKYIILRK